MLTKEQEKELKNLIDEIVDTAEEVIDDYEKNPSEMSGSITHVHESSPYLALKEERLIKFNDKQMKINPNVD